MAEAETKEAHTPDWSVVGPDLLAALKEARPFVALVESREMSNPALDALSHIDAAIQRAEAGPMAQGEMLKPCPFCGSVDLDERTNGFGYHWIACNRCGVQTEGMDGRVHAVAQWNTRAPSEEA